MLNIILNFICDIKYHNEPQINMYTTFTTEKVFILISKEAELRLILDIFII